MIFGSSVQEKSMGKIIWLKIFVLVKKYPAKLFLLHVTCNFQCTRIPKLMIIFIDLLQFFLKFQSIPLLIQFVLTVLVQGQGSKQRRI